MHTLIKSSFFLVAIVFGNSNLLAQTSTHTDSNGYTHGAINGKGATGWSDSSGHTHGSTSDGKSFSTHTDSNGYTHGSTSDGESISGWKNSSGHTSGN
jgi:hypothetical protein